MSTSKLMRLGPPALRRLRVHRYAALFRPLAGDERERLRDSLRRGYDPLHPIVVDAASGKIVDGRNRRDLAAELGLDAVVIERQFADEKEIAVFIADENLARRHLSQRERSDLAGRLVNGHGMSIRTAAKTAGVSIGTAHAAASRERSGVQNRTPGAQSRTTGADGKSYPAVRAQRVLKPPKPDLRIARVRKALDVLSRMAGETIPPEIVDALSDDEHAALVAMLDALVDARQSAQERSGRHASAKLDSIIEGTPVA